MTYERKTTDARIARLHAIAAAMKEAQRERDSIREAGNDTLRRLKDCEAERDALRERVAQMERLLLQLSLVGSTIIVRHGPPTTRQDAVAKWWEEVRAILKETP